MNTTIGNWIVVWSQVYQELYGAKKRIRVPLQCSLCNSVISRDASDVLREKKIPNSCSKCQTKHALKINTLKNKGIEIIDNDCEIHWVRVFVKFSGGENHLFVPIKCRCGKTYNAFVRFLHKRKHRGLCKLCAGKDKKLDGSKAKKRVGKEYEMTYVSNEHHFFCMRQIKTSDRSGYIPTHRLIMAEHLGRPLKSWEHVHHINQNKRDNRIENLQLVSPDKHCSITAMEIKIRRLEEALEKLATL